MLTFYVIRHGETVYGAEGRLQGDMDAPLSASGRQQAAAVAERLRDELARGQKVLGLYSNHLRRATETAAIIGTWLGGLDPVPVPALREMSLGEWQGKTPDELRAVSGAFDEWRRDPLRQPPPGGESIEEVQARALQAFAHLTALHAHETGAVVVVADGGPISLVLGKLGQQSLFDSLRIRQEYGALNVIEVNGEQGCVRLMNDTAHLVRPVPPAPLPPRSPLYATDDEEAL